MKKRFLSFAAAACVICLLVTAACSAGAAAADSGKPAPSPAEAGQTADGFRDVPADAWYAGGVAYCREAGIMNGVTSDAFDPEGSLTRAMLAVILHRAAGEPAAEGESSFPDVAAGTWYANAVAWADGAGLMKGYDNGRFGTGDPVTREQLAAILWRYDGQGAAAPASMPDRESVSPFALTAADWAVGSGVLACRSDGRFAPKENASRGEVAMALYQYLSGDGRQEEVNMSKITLTFNEHTYTATLEDNSSAEAFAALLKDGPLTVSARDYGNFEKVGELGTTLPRNDQQITTSAGDIILYQGNQITVYYARNSWSFTRLGRIDDPAGLREALGDGNVEITFQLAGS